MPRVNLHIQDLEELEELEELEDWEERIGLRSGNERDEAQAKSIEMRARRSSARGSIEALQRKRSERRKSYNRGGRRG